MKHEHYAMLQHQEDRDRHYLCTNRSYGEPDSPTVLAVATIAANGRTTPTQTSTVMGKMLTW